ncbi:MAG: PEP-CTERM sorting domain-containing protein [Candidatus Polarisedimenticolaceae bacterium]|nr:PEP-CTERM sorting domain-containing protein [Candidatus Polarisedimenticolaceae bacterium]
MHKFAIKIVIITLTALFISSTANASLILEQYASGTATPDVIGGYSMTDFAWDNGVSVDKVNSPLSGRLKFKDKNRDLLPMTVSSADELSWWNNGEPTNYSTYITDETWIRIILPNNTRAFSFNVGANLTSTNDNAWLKAVSNDGAGTLSKTDFNVNKSNTPGFGIYADNTSGQCHSIKSVIIDPEFWGIGNFSINQSDCTTSVPEPSSIFLLGVGLVGLLFAGRKYPIHNNTCS